MAKSIVPDQCRTFTPLRSNNHDGNTILQLRRNSTSISRHPSVDAKDIHRWRNAISRLSYLLNSGQALSTDRDELESTLDAIIRVVPELIKIKPGQRNHYLACRALIGELKMYRHRTAYGKLVRTKSRYVFRTLKYDTPRLSVRIFFHQLVEEDVSSHSIITSDSESIVDQS
ncbi:hypothetical protein Moror_2984 [Moniliophthora roreri MCA 2997]|uniref:Uncharacterized protein n=1 Tax=Moniliophthora roreri (strain MCA 2997) TaxID=1381753 RepID=V2X4K1_MONRO|nr:hypothetical protein Moror_2984 [Moniliophthora roreri MCA 2997]